VKSPMDKSSVEKAEWQGEGAALQDSHIPISAGLFQAAYFIF
jgi:hypothetical protein